MAFSFSPNNSIGPDFLPSRGQALLDIGSSNIYDCTVEDLTKFLRAQNVDMNPEMEKWIYDYACGSDFDSQGNRLNTSFLGQLCKVLGIMYRAIDIFDGPDTIILDLNRDKLPDEYRGTFDVVLNGGTTEHVMNQFNAFEVIHDAAAIGAEMSHILPVTGFADHGYVQYTCRFFFDLAGYNGYEILSVGFDSTSSSSLFDAIRSYSAIFPVISGIPEKGIRVGPDKFVPEYRLHDTVMRIKYRKTSDKPFVGAFDGATSVGSIAEHIKIKYDRNVQ